MIKNSILDQSTYPICFPVTSIITEWIGKAISAREIAILYNIQIGEVLETVEEIVVANEDEDE